ncbi:MAG: discoidin domain-containing protein, partial [bacterium]
MPQVLAAGTQFIRYPGGSSSDDFHWNGDGSFDAGQHWVPSATSYGLSWEDDELYRGTTSASYGTPSNVTDGDDSTYWLSNTDTDFPDSQWVYVDLGSSQTATSVQINWGTPYATSFAVQYWNSGAGYPLPYEATSDLWVTCSAGVLSSTGGVQTVTFDAVNSEFYRVLCLASSVSPAQYAVAELTVFNGPTQISVNTGVVSAAGIPAQSATTASSTDVACRLETPVDMDFVSFMTWLHNLSPGAKPLITVNFGTGTPQEAAAWVNYANKVMGYGIKDWQIGNEMDGNWETGGPLSADDYGRRYIEFYNEMKAVDSTINISGPVSGGPYDSSDDLDGETYIQGFVNRLASVGDTSFINGIDFHWYPTYSVSDGPTELATVSQVQTFTQTDLPVMLKNLPTAATVPVLLSEYNGGTNSFVTTQLANGLWTADWLGRFVSTLGSRFSSNFWDLLEGDNGDTTATGYTLGMLDGSANDYEFQPRAAYWAMQMLTQDWSIPADTRAHTLVQAVSTQASLAAYADLRPDGVLSLMVVNTDPANAYATTLDFSGFTPLPQAATWTFDASNYAWETSSVPYHADPDLSPTTGTDTGVATGYTHSFPPFSITVLNFANADLPTNSPTMTQTPAPTPTLTPPAADFVLIDDFDEPDRNGAPPYRLNLWGGSWAVADSATTATLTYLAPGAQGTAYSCSWTSQVASGGWSDISTSLGGTFNATGAGYVGLEFWAYGDGNSYWAAITTAGVTDYNWYGAAITPPAGKWTFYQIPFAAMTRQVGWGTQTGLPTHPPANDITGLQYSIYGSTPQNFTLRLDQIGFYTAADSGNQNPPTPTPSISPTFSESPTPGASSP